MNQMCKDYEAHISVNGNKYNLNIIIIAYKVLIDISHDRHRNRANIRTVCVAEKDKRPFSTYVTQLKCVTIMIFSTKIFYLFWIRPKQTPDFIILY